MKKYIDGKLLKFALVGILNTVVGYAINFVALNVFSLNFMLAGALNYIPTSVMSFFLNKYFTFKSKGNLKKEALRFALNILICWVLAYGIAKPLTALVMSVAPEGVFSFITTVTFGYLKGTEQIIDNVATIVGMGLFVIFNYIGQRFFAFKDEE
ncbi:MAG: GtrA family protein [Clostridia bacterium]|nr:GtrA family protein [Clostridia bacterium]